MRFTILNESVPRLSPESWRQFQAAIDAPQAKPPAKLIERLKRRPPWQETKEKHSPAQ